MAWAIFHNSLGFLLSVFSLASSICYSVKFCAWMRFRVNPFDIPHVHICTVNWTVLVADSSAKRFSVSLNQAPSTAACNSISAPLTQAELDKIFKDQQSSPPTASVEGRATPEQTTSNGYDTQGYGIKWAPPRLHIDINFAQLLPTLSCRLVFP